MLLDNALVFIGEDEALIAYQLKQILNKLGIHHVILTNTYNALRTLDKINRSFDVIIIDHKMYVLFSYYFENNEKYNTSPFLIILPDDMVPFQGPRKSFFLQKPYTEEDLAKAIEKLVLKP